MPFRTFFARSRRKSFQAAWLSLAILAGVATGTLLPRTVAPTHPVPTQIADGATVLLACGAIYQGTLALQGKHGVTVKTAGKCGKARITPGRAVEGWTRVAGHVYAAPIGFTPAQVTVDGVQASAAHWPNRPWATSTQGMPDGDLAGATLVVLVNQSVIQARALAGRAIDTARPFYVEGKLWMLDSPGEWAVESGRLHVWTPDSKSPAGRVWAAPDANGIDADQSDGIVIDGVAIFSARDGISANGASNLTVRHTEIDSSHRDGIWASGSRGLRVHDTTVSNARRNGIDGWYAIEHAVITDSTIRNTGMAGMPGASDAGIMFGAGMHNRIENVHVTRSAYHGINVMRNRHSVVRHSVVEQSCLRLRDCGAIYTSARDRQPLHLRIENNVITRNRGPDVIGIYLDDDANAVTVDGNTISGNQRGLVVHDGFDNHIRNNRFSASTVAHIGLAQSRGAMRGVRIDRNTFTSTNGEQTFNLEGGSDLRQFALFDENIYISNRFDRFGHTWDGRSAGKAVGYTQWKTWMGQDARSRTVQLPRDKRRPGQGEGSLTAP